MMTKQRHFLDKLSVLILLCSLVSTVLVMNGEALGMQKIVDEDAETYVSSDYFTANDLNGSWADNLLSGSSAQVGLGAFTADITLTGDGAVISGNGAYVNDGSVFITGGGYYRISGTLTNGSIIVDAYSSSKVWILLDGADISCSDGPALQVLQAEKVFLTLEEGTVNSLSDGQNYSDDALSDGAGGVIYAHDDLTINGSGSLVINGAYKHGIEANDELVITGGNITISAVSDGIHANDSVRITDAEITIDAGDDAVCCDTEIIFAGGTLLVGNCYEGLEAPQILVLDGEITIYPEDDGMNANGGSSFGFGFPAFSAGGSGSTGSSDNTDGFGNSGNSDSSGSSDEEDQVPCIDIRGGTITIINETARDADGLDSNGDVLISGGTIRISMVNSGSNCAIDCGSESGGVCVITGGNVIACGSSQMAEGFDSSSTQCSVLYNTNSGAEAGTVFSVKDTEGNILASWEVPCSFSSVNVSIPELTQGETYTVAIGDSEEEITLDEVSASYGDAGGAMSGGAMNWGGMNKRESGERPAMHESFDKSGTDEMPEGSAPPEMGEMPEGSTPPEIGEMQEGADEPESADSSGHGRGQGMNSGLKETSPQDASSETDSSTGILVTELSPETWISLGVSAAALSIAILWAQRSRLRTR